MRMLRCRVNLPGAEMPDESLNVTDLGVWYVGDTVVSLQFCPCFVLGAAQCLFLSQPLDKEGRVCCCGGVEGYCSCGN